MTSYFGLQVGDWFRDPNMEGLWGVDQLERKGNRTTLQAYKLDAYAVPPKRERMVGLNGTPVEMANELRDNYHAVLEVFQHQAPKSRIYVSANEHYHHLLYQVRGEEDVQITVNHYPTFPEGWHVAMVVEHHKLLLTHFPSSLDDFKASLSYFWEVWQDTLGRGAEWDFSPDNPDPPMVPYGTIKTTGTVPDSFKHHEQDYESPDS